VHWGDMDKGKGKAGGEEELAKAAKQLNINNYSASFKMQELEPEFSPESTDFYGAPVSPRISTELGGAFLMGNNPYLEKPILKLHEPILPKSLSAVLESNPTTPVDDKDAIGTGTKVVVTIGPACHDVETMVELIRNGMSCARIDLTNGDIEFHVRSIRNLQEASSLTMRMVAIMVDTVGPEIFVISGRPTSHEEGWPKWGKATDVEEGQTVVLTSDGVSSFCKDRWPVTYPKFSDLCKVGDRITVGRYLSTGMEGTSVTLEVKAIINEHDVECVSLGEATLNGLITVFLQDKSALGTPSKRANVDLPILSPRDTEMIKILGEIKQQGSDCLDFVALSYASTMEEIESVRKTLDAYGLANTKIIAKIETKRALNSFESILKAADGVIFSRGNLGIDVPVEKFPMLQKTLIRACNLHGKPVLATRVVDSMTNSPRPTRAEATDISNLVIDGIDGIVLGSETLRGMFPVITVKTVLHCAKEAEKVYDNTQHFTNIMKKSGLLSQLESMASSSVRVADKVRPQMISVTATLSLLLFLSMCRLRLVLLLW